MHKQCGGSIIFYGGVFCEMHVTLHDSSKTSEHECTPLSVLFCYLDINECNVTAHGCEDECVNIAGSYYCQCNSGKLHVDNTTCDGKVPLCS